MQLRTRFTVFGAAALLTISGFFAAGVAQAAEEDDGNPASPPLSYAICLDPPAPTLVGGGGNDTLVGGNGVDVIYGLGGNDAIYAGPGPDVVLAGDGFDAVWAGDGNDIICAGEGDDSVWGLAGNDTVYGEPGDDQMLGGDGQDWLIGQANVFGDTGNGQAGIDACPTTEAQVSC